MTPPSPPRPTAHHLWLTLTAVQALLFYKKCHLSHLPMTVPLPWNMALACVIKAGAVSLDAPASLTGCWTSRLFLVLCSVKPCMVPMPLDWFPFHQPGGATPCHTLGASSWDGCGTVLAFWKQLRQQPNGFKCSFWQHACRTNRYCLFW